VVKNTETIHLAVLDAQCYFYIDKLESPKSLRLYSAVGKKGPVYCTGLSVKSDAGFFCLKTNRDSHRPRNLLSRHTGPYLITPQALRADLQQVQKQAFSLRLEEHEMGIKCAGSAYFQYS